jgi:hypothetical protein
MPVVRDKAQGPLIQFQRRSLPEVAGIGYETDGASSSCVEEPASAGRLKEDGFNTRAVERRVTPARNW